MSGMFSRGRRKVAAVIAIALVASLSQVGATNAASPSKPRSGGDITVGIFNQVLTTCYTPNVSNSGLGVLKTVFEGIVEQKSDGTMVPFLAESFSPSADFKTWTVKLRPNIKFHSGEALDAKAAALNMNSQTGFTYLSNPIAYEHTAGSAIPFTANLKAVRVLDSLTFAMDLYTPQVDWMETVYASGRFYMRAPSDIANKVQCATKGQGTGPFKFEKYSATEIKVVKNPTYWRRDKDGNFLPYLDSITFKTVNEASQRVNGLKSGSLDAAQFTGAGEVKQILAVKANKNLGYIESPDDFYPVVWLNQAVAPFNNANARLAVAHAWDAEAYYKARSCVKGTCLGAVPTSMVSPRNVMHNKAGFIKTNIAKAKEYAAAYKAETGKDLTFTIPADTSTESQANAKATQQIFKKAGITTTLLIEDTATQVAKAFPSTAEIAKGNLNPYPFYGVLLFEGRGTTFTLPFLQTNVFLEPGNGKLALTRALLALGAGLNVGRNADVELSKLIWDAKQDVTAARTAKLKAITKYVQEKAYLLPLPTQVYGFGFSPKLKGFDKFTLASGGQGRAMTNAGINWTAVYLEK